MRDLRYLKFIISNKIFSDFVVNSTTLQKDGSYSLCLDPGLYALCVGNLGVLSPNHEVFPVDINGCFEVTVRSGEERSTDIFLGEGGVTFK